MSEEETVPDEAPFEGARFDGPEQAFHGYLRRRDGDEAVSFDELLRRFPAWRAELEELRSAWEAGERRRRDVGQNLSELLRLSDAESAAGSPPWFSETTREVLSRLLAHASRRSRYREPSEIAAGGMGRVLKVWDDDLRRSVAMKVIRDGRRDDDEGRFEILLNRFLEEAQVTAQLNHPGVVPVYDVGLDEDGQVFYTMPEITGGHLGEAFERHRRGDEEWSRERLLGVLLRIAETMAYAHSQGVVHRDLKPANVMVGEFGEVQVMDWGLALLLDRDDGGAPVQSDRHVAVAADPASPLASVPALQPGTPWYMAPEQAAGRAELMGPGADVYALGAILYELLSGAPPFWREDDSRTPFELRGDVATTAPLPLDARRLGVPDELVAICRKAMAARLDDRYPSMNALASDLRAYVEGRVVAAHRTGPWIELRKWVRRNRSLAATIAATVAVVLSVTTRAAVVEAGLNEDLRRENAEASIRSADLASRRGGWNEALELLAQAEERGYDDTAALRLRRAKAYDALARREDAGIELAALAKLETTPQQSAQVQLLRATRQLVEFESTDEALAGIEAALELGLPEVDELYARALLAPDSPSLEAGMRAVLELDPYHQGAHSHLMTVLFFLGRREDLDAHATSYRALYPDDPAGVASQALAAALRQEPVRGLDILEELEPALDGETYGALRFYIVSVSMLNRMTPPDFWIGGPPDVFEMTGRMKDLEPRVAEVLATAGDDGSELNPLAPIVGVEQVAQIVSGRVFATSLGLPALANGYGRVIEGARHMTEGNHAEAYALFEQGAEYHPEGYALFVQAGAIMESSRDWEDSLRLAEGVYERAIRAPSMFGDGASRAARHFAMQCESFLLRVDGEDEARRERLRENLHFFATLPDPTSHELGIAIARAREVDEHDHVRRLYRRRSEVDDSLDPSFDLADFELEQDRPAAALDALHTALGRTRMKSKKRKVQERIDEVEALLLERLTAPEDE